MGEEFYKLLEEVKKWWKFLLSFFLLLGLDSSQLSMGTGKKNLSIKRGGRKS